MATQLQIRRGTTAQMNAFTGAEGELAVNTSTDTVHVHDGATAGGFALAKADGSNIATYAGSFTTLAASGAVTLSSTLAVTGTVTADSNLLIGQTTTSPTNVNGTIAYGGADAGIIYLQRQTGTDQLRFYTGGNRLGFVNTASSTLTLGTANFPLVFQTNDTERMRLTAAGALQLSDVNSPNDINTAIYSNSDVLEFEAFGTNGAIAFSTGSGVDEGMRISGSNVGIGTSSPSSFYSGARQLVVGSGSGEQGITVYGGNADTSYLLFADGTSGAELYAGQVNYSHANNSLNFLTNGITTPRMTLDASGNLLVGTTSHRPAEFSHPDGFEVRADVKGQIQNTVTSAQNAIFNRDGTDGGLLLFRKEGIDVGSIGTYSGDLWIGQGNTGLLFNDGGDVLRPANASGGNRDGIYDLGASDSRFKDLYLSGVANVGSIVQTGSTSSLVASFENTNTSGYGMRITTYSSGVEYALAVDSYGGGYSRDFVIGVNGYIYSPPTYALTTASAANMHISSAGGLLFRSTSSARYKNTITDATHGLTELLTLRPVTYKGNNDGDTVFGGLIAEEVHDAGLTEFVQYNEEDQPDALAYGNMVSLCIKAIQELKEELNTATARITELENN